MSRVNYAGGGFIPFQEKFWQFRSGLQFTIRRGAKSYPGEEIYLIKLDSDGKITDERKTARIFGIQHIRFCDIALGDLVCFWHLQPAVPVRTQQGIIENALTIMRECYSPEKQPSFLPEEIVSLVWFEIIPNPALPEDTK